MRRRVLVVLSLALTLAGCESVIGVDFGSYKLNSCSPLSASDCPSGTRCLFDAKAAALRCTTTAPGDQGQDQTCSAESDCGAGLACIKFATNNSAHCSAYCTSNTTCGGTRGCYEFSQPRKVPGGTVGACGPLITACDPLATTSACDPERCTLLDTDYTICISQDAQGGVGAACANINECVPGTTCLGSGQSGTCTALCEIGGAACASGTCTAFAPSRKLADVEYGYCK